MAIIYQTENFEVVVPEKPHVSRTDGGHIVINPKISVEDRTKLSPELARELMKLTMIVGEAMKNGLGRGGVDIGRINYQDNGNWRHELHIHLYGRSKNAVTQKYGTPLAFPATGEEFAKLPRLEPLTENDIKEIQKEITLLLGAQKYIHF